jgi:cytochrome c oxidase cbb3-type subunit 2
MMMHFFNPRLVQPYSIMPRYDYLWGEKDASGNPIDYDGWRAEYTKYATNERIYAPDVPVPNENSEAAALIDFVLSLK